VRLNSGGFLLNHMSCIFKAQNMGDLNLYHSEMIEDRKRPEAKTPQSTRDNFPGQGNKPALQAKNSVVSVPRVNALTPAPM